jgi:hypothetical protein
VSVYKSFKIFNEPHHQNLFLTSIFYPKNLQTHSIPRFLSSPKKTFYFPLFNIFHALGFHIHSISFFHRNFKTCIILIFPHSKNSIRLKIPKLFPLVDNAAIFVDLEGTSHLSDTQKWIQSID